MMLAEKVIWLSDFAESHKWEGNPSLTGGVDDTWQGGFRESGRGGPKVRCIKVS